ncbi:MAG TPA: hypothetical protein VK589_18240 [Chryseolinea sp.]|nr:hypothetical protein [Chryseolinea sp.]
MKNSIVILVMVFVLCNACQQKRDKISDFLKGLDTTFIVDENGKKWTLISDPKSKLQFTKIEDIDNSINGFVKYHYSLFNGDFVYDQYGTISKGIYKEVYFKNEIRVYISDDTLNVGDQFHGTAWFGKPPYRIEV